jgi:hypothetical protein
MVWVRDTTVPGRLRWTPWYLTTAACGGLRSVHDCRTPKGPPSSLAQLSAAGTQTTLPCHTTQTRRFFHLPFRPEIGPTIRTFVLCLVLRYENAL